MIDSGFVSRSRQRWDEWADGWNKNPRRMALNDEIVASAIEQLGPPPQHVLDAGCGSGRYARWLTERGYQVTAMDQAPRMVALAQAKIGALSGICHVGDLSALAYPTSYFDAVMALTVIEWVADPVTSVQELARVTRPGGRISLGVLGAGSQVRDRAYRRFYGAEVMNTVMPWEAARMLTENGWHVTDQRGVYRERHPPELIEQLDERLRMCAAFIWFIGAVRRSG